MSDPHTSSTSAREGRPPLLAFHVPKQEPRSELRRRGLFRRWWRALLLRGTRKRRIGLVLIMFALSQAGIITWLALTAPAELPVSTDWLRQDKLLHGLAFGWLSYWTMAGLYHMTRLHVGWACFLTILLAGVGWGSGVEVAQSFTPERTFDLMDILANTVGAIIVTSLLVIVSRPSDPRPPRFIRMETHRG